MHGVNVAIVACVARWKAPICCSNKGILRLKWEIFTPLEGETVCPIYQHCPHTWVCWTRTLPYHSKRNLPQSMNGLWSEWMLFCFSIYLSSSLSNSHACLRAGVRYGILIVYVNILVRRQQVVLNRKVSPFANTRN